MAGRTPEQVREHYEIEKALARKLREAPREARRGLYAEVYNELFRRIAHLPQLSRKASPEEMRANAREQMKVLGPFLRPGCTFLEVGPGDCSVSLAAAETAGMVYAVDVSDEITGRISPPPNFRLVLADATRIPLPAGTVDLAYSSDLIEHLHPEDAAEHLASVREALAPGGRYVCVTPNRLGGPWDVSGPFDEVATGLHLKEYSTRELAALFRRAGFSRVRVLAGLRGRYATIPALPAALAEDLVFPLPRRLRKPLSGKLRFLAAQYIRMVGAR